MHSWGSLNNYFLEASFILVSSMKQLDEKPKVNVQETKKVEIDVLKQLTNPAQFSLWPKALKKKTKGKGPRGRYIYPRRNLHA